MREKESDEREMRERERKREKDQYLSVWRLYRVSITAQ